MHDGLRARKREFESASEKKASAKEIIRTGFGAGAGMGSGTGGTGAAEADTGSLLGVGGGLLRENTCRRVAFFASMLTSEQTHKLGPAGSSAAN